MKNLFKPINLFKLFLLLVVIIISAIAYPKMPEIVPIHWNYAGEPDNYGSKIIGAFLIPAIIAIMLILFPILSKIDPKAKNYTQFAGSWHVIQITIMFMLAYFHLVQLYIILHPDKNYLLGKLFTAGLGVMFVILGNFMGKVRQNYFVGIKTPWALNDPEVWQKTQRFGGWVFVIGGLIFLLQALIWQYVLPIFIVTITTIIILPIAYSYFISRKK